MGLRSLFVSGADDEVASCVERLARSRVRVNDSTVAVLHALIVVSITTTRVREFNARWR